MLIAVIYDENVSINDYPNLKDINELKTSFVEGTEFVILDKKPEEKEGYQLKHDGSDFYYEEIVEPEYEPTETELIQAEILLNQADIIAKQNEQDEVLAEILLNQMGV